ncbi:protein decapping 5-like isoform X2 [Nymphaea colorata]|uniref:protein decapping 5-like isoform X2 n=1 Tax=Nymphaea colorata TaxID=210225 RepID=UPI00129EE21A|nr:protein decapping 5-like isoform X2 [Nymphaea colorata]
MEDSGKTSSGAADSYVGSLISLTSKSEIRYEGLLASINTEESSIGLQNVRSYGTEGRKKDGQQIPPSDKIYEYILFRGKDIKDLQVKYTPAAHNTPELHHDPAIIQSHFSEGPLDSRGFSSLGTAMTSMPYHEGYVSSHIAGSNSFTVPSIQDGNPSLSLDWHGCYRPSNGIPYTSCSQEPPLQHSLIQPSIHLSSSVSGLVDPPPLTAYGISTKVPASLLPKPDLTANSLHRPIIPHSLGHKLHHSEVHPFATFISPTSGVANASALPVMPSDNLLYNNLPSMSASVQSDISSSTFSITPTKVPETSLLESELVTNSIRVSPPTYGQEVNSIASPFQNNGWYAPVTNPAVWSMPKSETSTESSTSGPSALGPSILKPGQCLQPGAFNDSLLQTFDNDKEIREATVPSSSKMSSFVSTLNTQRTLPSTPICSDKQNQLKAMEYAEEFDFVAMNEKFKKEEVWGTLGKVMQKTSGGRNENDVDELVNENDGAQFTKFSNRAVYVKDEFFDSISCGSLDRARRNQHGRYSERTKVDTETFGDFQQRPYTGRGRGYLANYRGAYYRGRGYRHGWRGRGEDGVGEQG